MVGRLAMGFANVRAGTRVLMLVLVQAPVSKCFGVGDCFCPHCPGKGMAGGYSWVVNNTIAPAIRALLKQP